MKSMKNSKTIWEPMIPQEEPTRNPDSFESAISDIFWMIGSFFMEFFRLLIEPEEDKGK
jgi:hypothetical protein